MSHEMMGLSETTGAKEITLDMFHPRDYQSRALDIVFNKKYKKCLFYWARRTGKDILGINILNYAALLNPGYYLYVFPEYQQARKALWRGLTKEGTKIIDYIHPDTIRKINQQQMTIEYKNNSIIQVVGSNKYDSHRGVGCSGIIYSEYAYQDPGAHIALSPGLKYNDGFAIFLTTINGHNHAKDLWDIAMAHPDVWYAEKLSINDTKHISAEDVQKEIDRGEISWDMAQQEYFSNWDIGQIGSYFGKYIQRLRLAERITSVPYDAKFPVKVAWDIGNDTTAMIFYYVDGPHVKIIDYYENAGAGVGLEHYAGIFHEYARTKGYIYATPACVFPHDMIVTEWGGPNQTRLQKARDLGMTGIICEKKEVDDGIEVVRTTFPRLWIDEVNCKLLIKHLGNYRQKWDGKLMKYTGEPMHDNASHAADALRYMCISLKKDGISALDLDQRWASVQGRGGAALQGFFSDNKY